MFNGQILQGTDLIEELELLECLYPVDNFKIIQYNFKIIQIHFHPVFCDYGL